MEFSKWIAYAKIDPIGTDKLDHYGPLLAWIVDEKQQPLIDYYPDYDNSRAKPKEQQEGKPKQTTKEATMLLQNFAAMHNAAIADKESKERK